MKNIVVVGGSDGIGLALIQNLSGEKITNISRTPCVVAGVTNISADVSDERSLKNAFSQLEAIDALIYCAGTSLAAPVEYVKIDDLEYLFNVNLIGAIQCCKLAIPLLKNSDDGRFVALSSSGATIPIAYDAFYCASKAGLTAFCAAISPELPEIKSTAVIIGGTRTRFSFKRKVYKDCAGYADLKSAADAITKIEQTGYSAQKIAAEIADILYRKNPPATVTIGIKNRLSVRLYKLLPRRFKRSALRAAYNLSDR